MFLFLDVLGKLTPPCDFLIHRQTDKVSYSHPKHFLSTLFAHSRDNYHYQIKAPMNSVFRYHWLQWLPKYNDTENEWERFKGGNPESFQTVWWWWHRQDFIQELEEGVKRVGREPHRWRTSGIWEAQCVN